MATTNEKLDISALPPASRRELLSYYQYLLERQPAKKLFVKKTNLSQNYAANSPGTVML